MYWGLIGVEQTLNIFLREVLSKRYTNLSSDIISLLTGLDNVDSIFTDFVASLDAYIRSGRTGTNPSWRRVVLGSEVLTEHDYSGSAAESHTGGALHSLWSFPNWVAVILYASGLIPGSCEGTHSSTESAVNGTRETYDLNSS